MLTVERLEGIVANGLRDIAQYVLPLFVFAAGTSRQAQCATGVMVEREIGVFLVTARHVIEPVLALGEAGRLQVGRTPLVLRDVHQRAVSMGVETDLATVPISGEEVSRIGGKVLAGHRVATKDVLLHEYVVVIGFPGVTKEYVSDRMLTLTRNEWAAVVRTVEHDQFSLRIDPDTYENETNEPNPSELLDLGGVSGAPVFSLITGAPHMTIRPRAKLVGFVYEGLAWGTLEQKLFALKANVLLPDGTIEG